MSQFIPCPLCKTPIPFETDRLLRGERFVCPHCGAAIALPTESRAQVQEAVDKLEQLKQPT